MRSETVYEGGFSFLISTLWIKGNQLPVPPQWLCFRPLTRHTTSSICDLESARQAATRGHHKLSLSKNMTESIHSNPGRCQTATVLCLRYHQGQGSGGWWHNWIDRACLTLRFRLWPCSSYEASLLQEKRPHSSVNHPYRALLFSEFALTRRVVFLDLIVEINPSVESADVVQLLLFYWAFSLPSVSWEGFCWACMFFFSSAMRHIHTVGPCFYTWELPCTTTLCCCRPGNNNNKSSDEYLITFWQTRSSIF